MIQRRTDGSDNWQADAGFSTASAADLQTLLEAIVRRYQLRGAVIANHNGHVRARVGGSLADATDGFEAAIAGDSGSLKNLAEAIEGKTLPRYFSQGTVDAYADSPAPGLVVLYMRERPDVNRERGELEMVSDYNVAKEMTEELRAGITRLGIT
jgi:hypothetical protein